VLGAWYAVLTALYFIALIAVSGTVTAWMRSPRIRRRLDAMTGLVLVGFGVRLATER
jgi:threonine/homoserine/homoserine lactone efflux protein